MKASEWFEYLPEPICELAKRAMVEQKAPDPKCVDMETALSAGFNWKTTDQGVWFWADVYDVINKGLEWDDVIARIKDSAKSGVPYSAGYYSKAWDDFFSDKHVGLPSDPAERKKIPVYNGFIKYFPLAIVEVTKLSMKGNEQHNPGKPLQWDRSKSGDELDAMMRHVLDGDWAAVAWRAMANLQKECERSK